MTQDHPVLLIGHHAGRGGFAGPVQDLRVEDGGRESVARAEFQPGGGSAAAHSPAPHDVALPESEDRPGGVRGQGGTAGTEGQRAHRHGGAALTDACDGHIGVGDGEVRRPGHGQRQALAERPDPGDRSAVAERDGEPFAQPGPVERPAQHGTVEALRGVGVPGQQVHPAGCPEHFVA